MSVLLKSVRCQEPKAIKEMIEGHLRLANSLVASYVNHAATVETNELVSAAFYAVVHAVNRIANGSMPHSNASGYIAKFIHQRLHRALRTNSVVRNTRHILDKGEGHAVCCQLDASHDIPVAPDTSIEAEELLASLVSDEADVKLIRMLRLGHPRKEIAVALDLNETSVGRRITRIRNTYMELLNE